MEGKNKFKKWIPAFAGMTIWAGMTMTGTAWAVGLVATPSTFDFGWCPAEAKVSAEFIIKNISDSPISLDSLRPSCGCTAAEFSPETLASDNETKIGLTFNTRGYEGLSFHKPATLKTGGTDTGIEVTITGFVLDPNAKIVPDGSGLARFEPGGKKKEIVAIRNKGANEVSLQVVQKPADWASIDLDSSKIPAGGTTELEIKVKGSMDETKTTSATFEATGNETPQRFTVAIQTGPKPEAYKPPHGPQPTPTATPVQSKEKPAKQKNHKK